MSGILPGSSSFTAPTTGTRDGIRRPVPKPGNKAITGAGEGRPEMGARTPGLSRDKREHKTEASPENGRSPACKKVILGVKVSCLGGSGDLDWLLGPSGHRKINLGKMQNIAVVQ